MCAGVFPHQWTDIAADPDVVVAVVIAVFGVETAFKRKALAGFLATPPIGKNMIIMFGMNRLQPAIFINGLGIELGYFTVALVNVDAAAFLVCLKHADVRFVTESDIEVILQSYIRWGDDFIKRLHGFFAFEILDQGRLKQEE